MCVIMRACREQNSGPLQEQQMQMLLTAKPSLQMPTQLCVCSRGACEELRVHTCFYKNMLNTCNLITGKGRMIVNSGPVWALQQEHVLNIGANTQTQMGGADRQSDRHTHMGGTWGERILKS